MQTLDVDTLLDTLSRRLREFLAAQGREEALMIGVHTGGIWVAQRLHSLLAFDSPLGELSIAFYRDDFSRIGVHPNVRPSNLPFDVENRHIVLVDDVLYTGRTVRAALNEVFDYGRPASICLAVLVDRGDRELPIQADVIGDRMELKPGEHIKLQGPEPLQLLIQQAA
jgi:pyrimidine operon attenuation protein/uracil phosphoribosyltransferase